MPGLPIALCGLLLATAAVSLLAFANPFLQERLLFSTQAILQGRQFSRLWTSALVHANGFHLFVNGFSLFVFGREIEVNYGPWVFLLIYAASVLGGSLLSLFLHRHQEYRAVGASGGVCGVIFATVFLTPGNSIFILPFPIPIPDYLYALGFLIFAASGARNNRGNVGHDAHLGGAMMGLCGVLIFAPEMVWERLWLFLLLTVVSAGICVWLLRRLPGANHRAPMRKQRPAEPQEPLHRCVVCGRTELSDPDLEFRVGRDGSDYCCDHLGGASP